MLIPVASDTAGSGWNSAEGFTLSSWGPEAGRTQAGRDSQKETRHLGGRGS